MKHFVLSMFVIGLIACNCNIVEGWGFNFGINQFPSVVNYAVESLKKQGDGSVVKAVKRGSINAGRFLEKQTYSIEKVVRKGAGSVEDLTDFIEDIELTKSCTCKKYTCSCCLHLEVDKVHLNDTVCLNMTYLLKEMGFKVELLLNGNVLFEEEISVENPPPICAGIPLVEDYASLCLRFQKMKFRADSISGCADIEVRLKMITVGKFNLGCFKLPFKTANLPRPHLTD